MKKSTIIIIVLGIGLVVSNAWWAFQLLDAGVSYTYLSDSLKHNEKALEQVLRLLPVVAQQGIQKEEIIKAACPECQESDIFEKEGFTWVSEIGLEFNSSGQLIGVKKSWSFDDSSIHPEKL